MNIYTEYVFNTYPEGKYYLKIRDDKNKVYAEAKFDRQFHIIWSETIVHCPIGDIFTSTTFVGILRHTCIKLVQKFKLHDNQILNGTIHKKLDKIYKQQDIKTSTQNIQKKDTNHKTNNKTNNKTYSSVTNQNIKNQPDMKNVVVQKINQSTIKQKPINSNVFKNSFNTVFKQNTSNNIPNNIQQIPSPNITNTQQDICNIRQLKDIDNDVVRSVIGDFIEYIDKMYPNDKKYKNKNKKYNNKRNRRTPSPNESESQIKIIKQREKQLIGTLLE